MCRVESVATGVYKIYAGSSKGTDQRRENCWEQVTAEGQPEGPRAVEMESVMGGGGGDVRGRNAEVIRCLIGKALGHSPSLLPAL